jgi:hypothetical protein
VLSRDQLLGVAELEARREDLRIVEVSEAWQHCPNLRRHRIIPISDTVRVFGNTAYDVGTVRTSRSGGDEDVGHYLVVLRRGLKVWNINSLAVVPETSKANAKDSAGY